jgi:hypothetical protein
MNLRKQITVSDTSTSALHKIRIAGAANLLIEKWSYFLKNLLKISA